MVYTKTTESTTGNANSRFGRPRFRGPNRDEGSKEFDSKILDLARVSRVSAGGRKFKFRATLVLGNKKGKVGVGIAKGLDVAQAIEKATRVAKKHLIEVPIVNETIPYEIYAKYGPAMVLLRPQRKGRGLVAGGTVRVICTLAGIKNVSSKILGRTGNKLNNAKATIIALKKLDISSRKPQKKAEQKPAKEEIIEEEKK